MERKCYFNAKKGIRDQSMIIISRWQCPASERSAHKTWNERTEKSGNEAQIHDEIQIDRDVLFHILLCPMPASASSLSSLLSSNLYTHFPISHTKAHIDRSPWSGTAPSIVCMAHENGCRLIVNTYCIIHYSSIVVPSVVGRACINKRNNIT